MSLLEDLRVTADTLNQLVTFLTEERRAGDQAVKDILLTSHPIFGLSVQKLKFRIRIFFEQKRVERFTQRETI